MRKYVQSCILKYNAEEQVPSGIIMLFLNPYTMLLNINVLTRSYESQPLATDFVLKVRSVRTIWFSICWPISLHSWCYWVITSYLILVSWCSFDNNTLFFISELCLAPRKAGSNMVSKSTRKIYVNILCNRHNMSITYIIPTHDTKTRKQESSWETI